MPKTFYTMLNNNEDFALKKNVLQFRKGSYFFANKKIIKNYFNGVH